MGVNKRGFYSPWGYQEENDYQSSENQFEVQLNELVATAVYNKDDKKIHFFNNDNEELSGTSIDTTEFASGVIESATYDKETNILTIIFSNGDVVEINLADIIDENEFGDGLQVNSGGVVSILIDSEGEPYLSTSESGLKISGVDAAIDVETQRAKARENEIEDSLNSEIARAVSAETALNEKIDQEISDRIADVDAEEERAKAVEQALDEKIDAETARAISAETDLQTAIDTETERAKAAEQAELTRATQIEQVINHRVDVLNDELDSEESTRESADELLRLAIEREVLRATSAETAINQKIDQEISDRIADVDAEEERAEAAEEALDAKIDAEIARAASAETDLQAAIEAEGQRAEDAEQALDTKIDAETSRALLVENDIKASGFFNAEYDSEEKVINFINKNGDVVDTVDATPFIKDGMIDSVYIDHETEQLVIVWNTDAGKTETRIDLSDIFDPTNYYTKDEVDTFLNKKVDKQLNGTNGKALIFNESDGGGAKFEHNDGTWSFAGVNDGGENGIAGQIYALKKNAENKFEGSRIDVTKNGMYYTVGSDSAANRMVAENEIATKGDIVGAETELFRLEQLLGHKDNDTLVVSNEYEAAFGKYNESHTDENPSGQTIFSIGNGTSDDDRMNLFEVRKNGDVYMWVEGDFIQINKLLAMLTNEVYDDDSTNNNNLGD